jgi:hypothetical protein
VSGLTAGAASYTSADASKLAAQMHRMISNIGRLLLLFCYPLQKQDACALLAAKRPQKKTA